VAADAEADGAQPVDVARAAEVVQHGDPVRVELRDGRRGRARLARRLARVVELERHARQLAVRVDLRHADDEPARREPPGGAQRGLGELEDVGVEQHARPPPVPDRRDHDGADLAVGRRHPHVLFP
jgi:hypothetical protein